jgi:hypothetical protein
MQGTPFLQIGLKAIINGFIIFHVSAFLIWSMPESNLFMQSFSNTIRPYMTATGLWHGWAMFAPNPSSVNSYLEAEILFANGKKRIWTLPRIELEELQNRSPMERWNQWEVNLGNNENSVIWPDAARYIAKLHRDPSNKLVSIQFRRYWNRIPPPSSDDFQPLNKSIRYEHQDLLYTYHAKSSDLL